MFSPQQLVIRWIEFSAAGALLLVAAKVAIGRLRQPADRINVILMTFTMTALVPLLMLFAPVPHWQLGLVPTEHPIPNDLPAAMPGHDALTTTTPVNPKSHPGRTGAPRFVTYLPESNRHAPPEQEAASSTPVPNIPLVETTPVPVSRRLDPWWLTFFVLIIVHGLAIAYFIFESIMGARRLAQLTKRAEVAKDHVALLLRQITEGRGDQVRLLVSREINGPMAFGSLQPIIMIPESIATGDPAILQFCLKHEWTHIENGDLRAWGLTWTCQFLLWFQPLFWMLRRDLRVCQDFLADHLAAGDGPARIEYSALLLAFTKQRMGSPIPGAIALFDRPSHLSRRIHMLLHSNLTVHLRSPRAFCLGAGIAVFLSAALFGAVRLNTADGGAQAAGPDLLISAAQLESLISGALPETVLQDAKPPAENEKKQKPAEGDQVAAKIIRGSVVDQAGKPVAQAKLCLPLDFNPRRTMQAFTDDAGHFEFKIPVDWLHGKPKETAWTLWAYAPGFSFASENVGRVVVGSAKELDFKITLPSEEKTSFKILTPKGDPVRDALVQPYHYLTPVAYEYIPQEFLKIIGSRTNAEGIAIFSMLQRKHMLDIQIISEAFGDQTIRINNPPLEELRSIRLRAPGKIEGRLIAEKREWIRGIRLSFSTDNQDQWTDPSGTAQAVTDNEGRYVVPVIASGGPVRVHVGIDKALRVRPHFSDYRNLQKGETMRMDIPLFSTTLVHGTVQWKSNGKPVPNAEISVHHAGNRQLERSKTNENGYYEARVLPGQIGIDDVDLPNDDMLIIPPPHTQKYPLQVPEGALNFELPKMEVVKSRDLIGTLVGEKNEPGSEKQIVALHQGLYYGPAGRCMARTDSAGRFTVKVPEGMESTFEVFDEKTAQPRPATIVQKNPLILRYVALQPVVDPERAKKADVTLTGRVLSEGKPLAGVGLTLNRQSEVEPMPDRDNPTGPAIGYSSRTLQTIRTKSDSYGRYRLSGLKAGDEYAIDIVADYPLANLDWKFQHRTTKLEEQAKGDISLPDLNLRKFTQTLGGIVVDSAGKPVSGVHVGVSRQNEFLMIPRRLKTGSPPWTTTDNAGQFHLERLPDVPLQIVVTIPPEKPQPKTGPFAMQAADMNQQNIRVVVGP